MRRRHVDRRRRPRRRADGVGGATGFDDAQDELVQHGEPEGEVLGQRRRDGSNDRSRSAAASAAATDCSRNRAARSGARACVIRRRRCVALAPLAAPARRPTATASSARPTASVGRPASITRRTSSWSTLSRKARCSVSAGDGGSNDRRRSAAAAAAATDCSRNSGKAMWSESVRNSPATPRTSAPSAAPARRPTSTASWDGPTASAVRPASIRRCARRARGAR